MKITRFSTPRSTASILSAAAPLPMTLPAMTRIASLRSRRANARIK